MNDVRVGQVEALCVELVAVAMRALQGGADAAVALSAFGYVFARACAALGITLAQAQEALVHTGVFSAPAAPDSRQPEGLN